VAILVPSVSEESDEIASGLSLFATTRGKTYCEPFFYCHSEPKAKNFTSTKAELRMAIPLAKPQIQL